MAGQRNAGRPIAPFWTRTGLVTKVLRGVVVVVVVVVVEVVVVVVVVVVGFGFMKAEMIGAWIPLDCVTRNCLILVDGGSVVFRNVWKH